MHRRHHFTYRWLASLWISLFLWLGIGGCKSQEVTPIIEATPTPIPFTQTPTPTIVWFPPTATPTPFPTAVITPTVTLQPQSYELSFQDDFTSPTQWTLSQTASTSVALGVEELTLALNQPGSYLYSLRQDTELSDFYLEITASPSLCKDGDEYGLLLRVSPALEFYRFSLTCDGQVRLDKYFQGKASSPQPPIYSGAVPPGAPSISQLGVRAEGNELHFYVNMERQFSIKDSSLPSGGLGVFIRSNGENAVTVSFSDLLVYELEE